MTTTYNDPEFSARIDRLVNLLAYGQDVSKENPLEVAAARLFLKWQLDILEEVPTTQRMT